MFHQEVKLTPFKSDDYYTLCTDESIKEAQYDPTIDLHAEGARLIARYYSAKYKTNISFPIDISEKKFAALSTEERNIHYLSEYEFFDKLPKILQKVRKRGAEVKEYREAFILGMGVGGHSIPVIYFKEEGAEGILYANSSSEFGLYTKKHFDKNIDDFIKASLLIDIYRVEEGRQADYHSCLIDALALAKDATAIENGQYKIPKLLSAIKSRADKSEGYSNVLLPNELLKTAQISEFVLQHEEKDQKKIIHKKTNETLAEFRKRYTLEKVLLTNKKKRDISSYLKMKGFKYADIIETQSLLESFGSIYPDQMNAKVRKDFITQAKAELKKQGRLNSNEPRAGLYAFATDYFSHLLKQATVPVAPPLPDYKPLITSRHVVFPRMKPQALPKKEWVAQNYYQALQDITTSEVNSSDFSQNKAQVESQLYPKTRL